LRAGVISALSSQTGKVDTSLPTDGVLRKAALAGAAGGIAVAAAGGDEAAVTEAFLKSGGTVLVQAGSAEKSTTGPKLSEVAQTAQCISARDVDCFSKVTYLREKGKIVYDSTGLPKIDPKKFDPKEHLPKWSQIDPKSDEGKKHVFMSKISKLKDMEAIPLLKNEWILTWTFGRDGGLKSEKPAVVLTYIGKQQPFISNVSYGTSEAITNAQKSARTVPKTMVSADVLAKAIRVRKGSTVISTVSVNGVERDTFNFTAWLDLPAERSSAIESVNYYFDAETFINPKPGIHGGKKFEARWIGWGCAAQARVVATLIDGQKIIGRYNMCNVAGMGSSALADAEQKPVTTKEKENLPSSFLDSLFGDQKVNEPKK
jgi:hypothetical protein